VDRRWLLAAGVGVVAVLAGLWWGRGVSEIPDSVEPVAVAEDAPTSTMSEAMVVVHVAGWVAEPGLVSVPAGSRVGDAIAAAGGWLPGVKADALNLARPIADGDQVLVPGPTDAGGQEPSATTFDGRVDGMVDLNAASASVLESLPGVGPVLAERIVAHREANGQFEAIEDLLDVSGIGEAKLALIRDHVTVR